MNSLQPSDATEWWDNFRKLLDNDNKWPSEYLFKFIVPKAGLAELKKVFEGQEIDVKASTRGNYLSVTSKIMVHASDDVIKIYRAAGAVDGVISL